MASESGDLPAEPEGTGGDAATAEETGHPDEEKKRNTVFQRVKKSDAKKRLIIHLKNLVRG